VDINTSVASTLEHYEGIGDTWEKSAGLGDIEYLREGSACVLNQPTVTTQCNDNGTDSDPSDDTYTYTLNVTGTGNGASFSVSGDDTQANLAYGIDNVSTNSFGIAANSSLNLTITDDVTGSCNLTGVTVNAPATCSNASSCTTVTNTVSITGLDQTDSNNSNDSASADVEVCAPTGQPELDLALVKTASATDVLTGDTVTYTLTLTNNGPDNGTGIQVTDQLPNGVTYSSSTPSQGTYSDVTGIWDVGDLANGATATLTIEVTID